MSTEIIFKIATEDYEFEQAKVLFTEYVDSLKVDLSFQDFVNELGTIHEQYYAPQGGLILAFKSEIAVGCAGVRRLEPTIAELKRMYVKPDFRGYNIGANLLTRSMQLAKELGYEKIRLDTLQTMKKAQDIYRSVGFYEIDAYRYNPLEGAVYMEKIL